MSDPLEELAKQQQSRRVANVRSRGIRPAQYHAPQPRSSRNPLLLIIAGALVTIVILVIVGVALLGFGIWKTKQAMTNIASEAGLTSVPASSSPLANEAEKQAMECFSRHWTQTGQYWTSKVLIKDNGDFWAGITVFDTAPTTDSDSIRVFNKTNLGDHFIQTKDVTFDVDEESLSDADKLNGVEFRGTVDVITRSQVIRSANPQAKTWSKWMDYMTLYFPHGLLGKIAVNKINGKWTTEAGPTVAECQTIDPAIIPK